MFVTKIDPRLSLTKKDQFSVKNTQILMIFSIFPRKVNCFKKLKFSQIIWKFFAKGHF